MKEMKVIDENLGGTTPLDIIIKFKDEPKPIIKKEPKMILMILKMNLQKCR